jgi:bifunctional non-homologous end joining protein LigD
MKECRWLKPVLVGQCEFVEWTPDGHLRHSRYMGLREDMKPAEVERKVSFREACVTPCSPSC